MYIEALKKVFRNPRYISVSLGVSILIFLFSVWLPNLKLIKIVLLDSSASIQEKFLIPIKLLGSIVTNFSWFSAGYLILIAILAGINIGLVMYLVKENNKIGPRGNLLNLFGLGAGVLGVGCAACGSLIITALLGTAGGSIIAFLPFKGTEFGVLSVILLAASTHLLLKRVDAPPVCEIK